jgi:hypothetical protein
METSLRYTFKVLQETPLYAGGIGDIIEVELKISQYDEFAKDFDGILERYFDTAPAFVFDGKAFVADIQARQPDGFKEVLSKIADAHPASPLADRYKKKSIKEGQTAAVVKKIKDKVKKEGKQIVYRNRTKW